jgi:fatty acid desaturase
MRKKILCYPVDAWAVLLVLSILAAQISIYLFVSSPWLALLATVGLFPFCMSVLAYNHNHMHKRTFGYRPLNRLFEMVIFFQTGSSPFSGTLNHVLGHHATYLQPELDTLNWKRRDGSTMSKHEFALKKALWHYPSCFVYGRRKQNKSLFVLFLVYLVVCLAILAALVAYRPVPGLIAFVLPIVAMLYTLKMGAYNHHSGLAQDDHYTASRTNTSRFYNWATWNAGYHAAHHFKQALHWSELPAYHATLAPKIPAELQGEHWGEDALRRKTAAERQAPTAGAPAS